MADVMRGGLHLSGKGAAVFADELSEQSTVARGAKNILLVANIV